MNLKAAFQITETTHATQLKAHTAGRECRSYAEVIKSKGQGHHE